jgi:hypothetical protein
MTQKNTGRINLKFETSDTSQVSEIETLEFHPRILLAFDRSNPIPSINEGTYYLPRVPNHPSFDSFIYDAPSSRVTVFQVTDAVKHGVNPKGLRGLREITQRLNIDISEIRFVIVTSEESTVTCSVRKTVYNEFNLKMCFLEMTEGDLYNE